jgi:fumarate hydratase class II
MVCVRGRGNQTTVGRAGSQGHFQLNVFKPVIIHTVLESIGLLKDAMFSFEQHCLRGLEANREQLQANVSRSLMLVTALSPAIGYEKAARAARYADEKQLSLREAVLALSFMDGDAFDKQVDPRDMLAPHD